MIIYVLVVDCTCVSQRWGIPVSCNGQNRSAVIFNLCQYGIHMEPQ